jgi:hypothetical protein
MIPTRRSTRLNPEADIMAANGPTNQDVLDQRAALQGQLTTLQQENAALSNKVQALQQAAAAVRAGGGSGGQVGQAGGGQQQL